jgi:hypothetical protein
MRFLALLSEDFCVSMPLLKEKKREKRKNNSLLTMAGNVVIMNYL